MSENEMILAGGADLVKQSELYEPMLYYGSKARITVDYVSDIHLLHHAPYFNYDIQKTIRAIAKSPMNQCHLGVGAGQPYRHFSAIYHLTDGSQLHSISNTGCRICIDNTSDSSVR